MGWVARGLLLLGGVIAGWFVAPDADNLCAAVQKCTSEAAG